MGGKVFSPTPSPQTFFKAKLCTLVLPAREYICKNIKVLRSLTSDIAYGLDSVNEKVSSLETKLEETNDLNPELLAHLYNDGDRYAKVLKKNNKPWNDLSDDRKAETLLADMGKENIDCHKVTIKAIRPKNRNGSWLKVTFLTREDKIWFSQLFKEKKGAYGYTVTPLTPQPLIKYEKKKLEEAKKQILDHFHLLGHRLPESDLIVMTSTRMIPEFRYCWKVIIKSTGFQAFWDTAHDIKSQVRPGPPIRPAPSGLLSPTTKTNRVANYSKETADTLSAVSKLKSSRTHKQRIERQIENIRTASNIDHNDVTDSEDEDSDTLNLSQQTDNLPPQQG